MASFSALKSSIFEREERKQQYQSHIRGLNAYDRHKKFIRDYVDFYGKNRDVQDVLPVKTDQDTLREGYREKLVYKKKKEEKLREKDKHQRKSDSTRDDSTDDENGRSKERRIEEKPVYKKKEKNANDREKDKYNRKRDRLSVSSSTDEDDNSNERKKKARHASTSRADSRHDADDNFEEFLEGMFP